MKPTILLGMWFVCWTCASEVAMSDSAQNYVLSGPSETAVLEKALYECLPVYVYGISPSADRLTSATGIEGLKEEHLDKLQTWFDRVLTPRFVPKQADRDSWVGIPNLHWGIDCIVGKYSLTRNDGASARWDVEFQACDRTLGLSVTSPSRFSVDAGELTKEMILDFVTNILKIPPDKVKKVDIEKHLKAIADVNVCYGKIRCEWHERTTSLKPRKWWQYIPFWYTKGKLFVSITTADTNRRARIGRDARSSPLKMRGPSSTNESEDRTDNGP